MSDALQQARDAAARMMAGDTAAQRLGIRIDIPAAGEAIATMTVTADMLNGHALCHGGLLFTLADTAFAFACNAFGVTTVSSGANIDFLRPAGVGDALVAHAQERHRGRRRGVYDVRIRDQHERDIALFRGQSVALNSKPK